MLSLNKYRQIVTWYLHYLSLYKRKLHEDNNLTIKSREKMRILINVYTIRVKEFVEAVNIVRLNLSTENIKIIEEEFNCLKGLFEKMAISTERLLEIKHKIEEKIRLYERLQNEERLIQSIEPLFTTKRTAWSNNLLQEIHDFQVTSKFIYAIVLDIDAKVLETMHRSSSLTDFAKLEEAQVLSENKRVLFKRPINRLYNIEGKNNPLKILDINKRRAILLEREDEEKECFTY